MSRRNPGSASALGARVARERLAATLGGASDAARSGEAVDAEDAGRDEGRAPGLLELDVLAPGSRIPGPPAGVDAGDGRFLSGDAGRDPGPLAGRRRGGGAVLSARVRYRTGVRAAALLGILAVVLGGCFWWQAGAGGAQVVPLSESTPAATGASGQEALPEEAASGGPPGELASDAPGRITVHVAGAVARPGVVELPAGSRVHEAIKAAGGATDAAEPDRLNLAAVLEDGQKVLVPARGDPEPVEPPGGGGTAPSGAGTGGTNPGGGGGKINLNTAGVEELGTLPRVGPVLAQRIVDWRQQHGRFKTVQELDAVDGIGPKLLETLMPLVGV